MTARSTPLTDANVASLAKSPDCFCEADFARRLELDRAALMEALENLENDDGKIPQHAWKIVQAALAAARANFPTP